MTHTETITHDGQKYHCIYDMLDHGDYEFDAYDAEDEMVEDYELLQVLEKLVCKKIFPEYDPDPPERKRIVFDERFHTFNI